MRTWFDVDKDLWVAERPERWETSYVDIVTGEHFNIGDRMKYLNSSWGRPVERTLSYDTWLIADTHYELHVAKHTTWTDFDDMAEWALPPHIRVDGYDVIKYIYLLIING